METRKKNQGSDFYPDCLTISPSLGQRRGKQDPQSALSASGALALMVRERGGGRGSRKPGAEGWGTCSLYWTEVRSPLGPAFVTGCRLRNCLRSCLSQDMCCVNHLLLSVRADTDRPRSPVFTQALPSWARLGNSRQAALMPGVDPVLQGPHFPIPGILPSGSGLGVCNKEIILKKNMKGNH